MTQESPDAGPGRSTPDEKDWTWVLRRPCPECGFDPDAVTTDAIPGIVADVAARFAEVLRRPDAGIRPEPGTWSAIEYGRHIADVCDVMTGRLRLILASGGAGASFADWDQDAAAVQQQYWRSTAEETAALLTGRAEEAASAWSEPTADQWTWPGLRSNGSTFTAASLGTYFTHDLTHHLADVTR